MPVQIFTNSERERLNSFPLGIQHQDMVAFFTLSEADKNRIPIYSAAHNRLGFALQLCALRYMGFIPDDLQKAPSALVDYIADQLHVESGVLAEYGSRHQTRTEHIQDIMEYLGYRKANSRDLETLSGWLTERTIEHDKTSLIYELVCDKLRSEKIIRPGITILERLIAEAGQRAQTEIMQSLAPILTESCKKLLDHLLVTDGGSEGSSSRAMTPLSRLRQNAATNSPRSILNNLEKITFLKESGVMTWELTSLIHPNRLKRLAQIARRATARGLRRSIEERRYPILAAFLYQSLVDITDETMDMFDRCLAETDARSRGNLDEYRRSVARATNEKVKLFSKIGHLVLDENIPDDELRKAILKYISRDALRHAVEESERIARPLDDNYFDFLASRYSYLRQFTPAFLSAWNFKSNLSEDPILEAIDLLRDLNTQNRRAIPDEASIAFVPSKWSNYVLDDEGNINRRYYELCALRELRNAIRSGDIWLEHSRRYANPETYLIPKDLWPKLRPEVCRQIGTPRDGAVRLEERSAELEEMLTRVDAMLAGNGKVRLDKGELVVSPVEAEERPESAVTL